MNKAKSKLEGKEAERRLSDFQEGKTPVDDLHDD